jgi:hypothetical protein
MYMDISQGNALYIYSAGRHDNPEYLLDQADGRLWALNDSTKAWSVGCFMIDSEDSYKDDFMRYDVTDMSGTVVEKAYNLLDTDAEGSVPLNNYIGWAAGGKVSFKVIEEPSEGAVSYNISSKFFVKQGV